jgi:hypothetical protein
MIISRFQRTKQVFEAHSVIAQIIAGIVVRLPHFNDNIVSRRRLNERASMTRVDWKRKGKSGHKYVLGRSNPRVNVPFFKHGLIMPNWCGSWVARPKIGLGRRYPTIYSFIPFNVQPD